MAGKRVLSVGQCAADHGGIAWALRPLDVQVTPTATRDQALQGLRKEPFDLVLVNRVLDADGDSGLELIRAVKADDALRSTPVMMVSNYADAQQEAVQAGAEPGFGKAVLGRPEMLERVRPFLGG